MRKLAWIGAMAGWLAAASCGDDLDGESLVGAPCETSAHCDVGGVCVTSSSDGLCSMPCRFSGVPQQCPLGSYCHEQRVETSDETLAQMTLCYPACQSSSDCRKGYACNDVTDGPGKVCSPK